MTVRIVEFSGENPELVEGLCLHPSDPRKMLEVMTPYMEVRRRWLQGMVRKGLRVAVALGADGEKQGLVECVPVEWAAEPVSGEESLFINCLWVLPRYWKSGVARAMMEYVIARAKGDEDPRRLGLPAGSLTQYVRPSDEATRPRSRQSYGGITVLGYEKDRWFGYFSYMPASFFKRLGFAVVDRDGSRILLHLDLGGARRPFLMRPRMRTDVQTAHAHHVVEVLYSSQCPWSGWMIDGVMRSLRRFDVEVRLVNTDERAAMEAYGLSRGVCVDGLPLVNRLASGREVARAVERYLEEVKCTLNDPNAK
ncbi:MAG: GNAT family N-acetyltransferase [Bacillota bacterium]